VKIEIISSVSSGPKVVHVLSKVNADSGTEKLNLVKSKNAEVIEHAINLLNKEIVVLEITADFPTTVLKVGIQVVTQVDTEVTNHVDVVVTLMETDGMMVETHQVDKFVTLSETEENANMETTASSHTRPRTIKTPIGFF